jgi:4-alpha-glucanotransferase
MNYPGNPSGNWTWRMTDSALNESLQSAIQEINFLYDRENSILEQQLEDPA